MGRQAWSSAPCRRGGLAGAAGRGLGATVGPVDLTRALPQTAKAAGREKVLARGGGGTVRTTAKFKRRKTSGRCCHVTSRDWPVSYGG